MLKGKSLLEYTNLFSPNDYEKNDKIISKHFQQNLNKLKCIVTFVTNIENLKRKTKMSNILKKTLSLCFVYRKCGHEYKKYLKKKNQLKY